MARECPALALGQLGFLQFGHTTMLAGVAGEEGKPDPSSAVGAPDPLLTA